MDQKTWNLGKLQNWSPYYSRNPYVVSVAHPLGVRATLPPKKHIFWAIYIENLEISEGIEEKKKRTPFRKSWFLESKNQENRKNPKVAKISIFCVNLDVKFIKTMKISLKWCYNTILNLFIQILVN